MSVAYQETWVTIIAFVGGFIALYGAAVFLLLRHLFSPVDRRPEIASTGKLIFALAAGGLMCAAYAFYIEPNSLEITHITIPIDGLPKSEPPIKIAHLSDLHCDKTPRLEPQIPPAIAKEHPDLIFYTGDSLNSPSGFPMLEECLKSLKTIAPVVAVKGDWDSAELHGFQPLTRAGFPNTDAPSMATFTIRGARLCVVSIPNGLDGRATIDKAPQDMPLILLTHGPDCDVTLTKNTKGVDMICCGHTHGGQIAIPGYGALITQARTKKSYASGLNHINGVPIYTNRGIGMEGHFPRVRFCARPEVTIYELVPSGNPRKNSK